jgi:ectoine hydroxylase-related dioxygenase (phytanoyl-CoA dioxygenase family)
MSASDLASSFRRDGFVRGPTVLTGVRLDEVRRAVDRLLAGDDERLLVLRRDRDDPASQVHVVGACRVEPALQALAADPVVVGTACALMGTQSVRFFRDQLFVKAPFSPAPVPWHQDYSDWTQTTPPRHITCWIALDDATPANGCMHYLRGSHEGPLLPKIARTDTMESAFERLPRETRTAFAAEPVRVPAGGCVFHHCLTIHGSHGNETALPRRAVAITYMHAETRSASNSRPPLPKAPVFPEGALLDGPLFPELRP